ncbi:NAD(P)-dependent oxidoreductase [Membranicola marinus]|uniref:Saccharopine dehydrogenase [NAD(+), L-lysine-forming] n=1 Tax=Membranihabitans marinus TaxID=1227546 RepID=A0A953LCG8_9BACT|nr:NAD(P)-dependent oxidoreductase [Membranihabitans marinus]MBY5957764.1 NAD(P)-dependent oxidoreductase [Membranihabitans marinus]
MKIGIIKEGKIPRDARVVLKPSQCAYLRNKEGADLVVQSSEVRCYSDEEYRAQGVPVVSSVDDCDILLGVKEVPVAELIAHKTYFFFSHTIKAQPYNRELLRKILDKNIRLLDYEVLTDAQGKRLIAFGFFAGMVGAHNALLTYGRRSGSFALGRMKDAFDYAQIKKTYQDISWPAIKIVLTGKGRVGAGAAKVLDDMGIRKVNSDEFLQQDFDEAVYTQIDFDKYVRPKPSSRHGLKDFFEHPEEFESAFSPFAAVADVMINGVYWDNKAPAFFTKEDMRRSDYRIEVIADITCDIAPVSSIPSTLRATTIDDPFFGYDPVSEKETDPFQDHAIDMMTIDNLPNELPRDASTSFGQQFIEHIWPQIKAGDFEGDILLGATIAREGKLGPHFKYLEDFVAK